MKIIKGVAGGVAEQVETCVFWVLLALNTTAIDFSSWRSTRLDLNANPIRVLEDASVCTWEFNLFIHPSVLRSSYSLKLML